MRVSGMRAPLAATLQSLPGGRATCEIDPFTNCPALDTARASFYPQIMQSSPIHRHHPHHHHVANVSAERSEQVS